MRLLSAWIALHVAGVMMLPMTDFALGSGPHGPHAFAYGTAFPHDRGTTLASGGSADASAPAETGSSWTNQIYLFVPFIAGGELLLWILMNAGRAKSPDNDEGGD